MMDSASVLRAITERIVNPWRQVRPVRTDFCNQHAVFVRMIYSATPARSNAIQPSPATKEGIARKKVIACVWMDTLGFIAMSVTMGNTGQIAR